MDLAKNIEEFIFWGGDTDRLHSAKQELIEQLNTFHIFIRAKGFFEVDRQFLASVSNANSRVIMIHILCTGTLHGINISIYFSSSRRVALMSSFACNLISCSNHNIDGIQVNFVIGTLFSTGHIRSQP